MKQNIQIYNNPSWQPDPTSNYNFNIGDYVYAKQIGNNFYTRALVLSIENGIYAIQFDNGVQQSVSNVNELLIYYPCNCNGEINGNTYQSGFLSKQDNLENTTLYPNMASEISYFQY